MLLLLPHPLQSLTATLSPQPLQARRPREKQETPEVQGKPCLLFPVTGQRVQKVAEAGDVVTKLPL